MSNICGNSGRHFAGFKDERLSREQTGGEFMLIGGIQKLSLLDYPEKMCCTIFTIGCDYRCPFCHNSSILAHGPENNLIPKEDVLKFLRTRKGLLDGVCITGGEPLLQPGLEDFMREIKSLGFLVKLDTNGSYPERLKNIVNDGLVDYVAMDVKNSPAKYGKTVGIEPFDVMPIRESINFLLTDAVPYEFRTTVVKEFHTDKDLVELANWIQGTKHYYLQSFKDSGDVLKDGLHSYMEEEMQGFLEKIQPVIPSVELRGI